MPNEFKLMLYQVLEEIESSDPGPTTARIDFKQDDASQDDLIIDAVSDKKAAVSKPDWFQEQGIGYVIHSRAKVLDLRLKCLKEGTVTVTLRAPDIRNKYDTSKRLVQWIDYELFSVNGEVIFEERRPYWHDRPGRFQFHVDADSSLDIHLEWEAHEF